MDRRVAVLGAGPMGLGAAYELARQGYCPVVFEADSVIGGMASTFNFSGLDIERFYHFYCLSDNELFKVLDELGISEILQWRTTKMGYWFNGKVQKWGDPIALLRFRGLGIIPKIRYGLHVFLSTHRKDWRKIDQVDAMTWIRSRVGKTAFHILWQDLFDYKFYEHANNVSAAWIWSRIRRIGLSRESMFKEKLGYIEGGSQTLLNVMAEEIEKRGGQIFLGNRVSRVVIESGSITGIEVDGNFQAFNKVISTVPLPYLIELFPDIDQEYKELINSKKNIAVVCVIVKLGQQVTDYFWMNTKDPEMDIPGFVEFSNLRPTDESIVYVPFYLPVDHPTYGDSDDVFIQKVIKYLRKVNSKLNSSDFMDFRVSRYQYAQPICEPGYLDTLPPLNLGVPGILAADTSYYYPEDRGLSESIGFGRKLAQQLIFEQA